MDWGISMRLNAEELRRRARELDANYYIWPSILDEDLSAYTEYADEEIKYTVLYIRGCRAAMGLSSLAETLNELNFPHTEYARVLLAFANAGERMIPEECRFIARQQCMHKLNKVRFMQYAVKEENYNDPGEDEPWHTFAIGGTNERDEKHRIEEYEAYARCMINRYTGDIKWFEIKTPEHSAFRRDNMLIVKN